MENAYYAEVPELGRAEKQEVIDSMYKYLTLPLVCEKTGYALRRVMVSMSNDPEFKQAMEIAENDLAAYGEEELKRRAIRGVDKVVVNNGRVVHTVENGVRTPLIETQYSDQLLKFYLETQKREKFGNKINIEHNHRGHIALPVLSPDLVQLMLAMQRGDDIELITDQSVAEGTYEAVTDAEFEPVEDAFDII